MEFGYFTLSDNNYEDIKGRLLAAVYKNSSVLAMFDEVNKLTWESP